MAHAAWYEVTNGAEPYVVIGGVGTHVPLPHRDPLAKLQHCASFVQLDPSATHAEEDVATQ